jgi:hypothetical protein
MALIIVRSPIISGQETAAAASDDEFHGAYAHCIYRVLGKFSDAISDSQSALAAGIRPSSWLIRMWLRGEYDQCWRAGNHWIKCLRRPKP